MRRRTQDDEWPTVTPLNTVRGAFRTGDNEIRLLVRVTSDLLRGSGQGIHPAVATAEGVEPAQRKTFTSRQGGVTVFWKLASTSGASIGSLRAQAVAVEATTADTLILEFKLDDSSLKVSRVDPAGTVSHLVRQLLARPVSDPVVALAAVLECPTSEVTWLLRARGGSRLGGHDRRHLSYEFLRRPVAKSTVLRPFRTAWDSVERCNRRVSESGLAKLHPGFLRQYECPRRAGGPDLDIRGRCRHQHWSHGPCLWVPRSHAPEPSRWIRRQKRCRAFRYRRRSPQPTTDQGS